MDFKPTDEQKRIMHNFDETVRRSNRRFYDNHILFDPLEMDKFDEKNLYDSGYGYDRYDEESMP